MTLLCQWCYILKKDLQGIVVVSLCFFAAIDDSKKELLLVKTYGKQ
jgi:hypothetical protein